MNTDPYALIQQIEKANSWQEVESFVDKLIAIGTPAVSALLDQRPGLVTSRLHNVSAKVFARIGYPANAPALRFMVSDVSNFHSSTYDVSREALLSIGEPVLSIIADALEIYERDKEFNALSIESLQELEDKIQKSSSH